MHDAILDAASDAITHRERELRDEHAVYGLDALEELGLHPIICAGLHNSGLGVLREQPYPHEWTNTTRERVDLATGEVLPALPQRRDRLRCDCVLTPHINSILGDPLLLEKHTRAHRARVKGTLFESVAIDEPPAPASPHQIAPEDAFWLEVKVVSQFDFATAGGAAGPSSTYSSSLVRGVVSDLKKLSSDSRIQCGGLLLVLFTATFEVSRHDLPIVLHKCLDRSLPITSPLAREIPIQDRIGNGACTLALIPLRPRISHFDKPESDTTFAA